jgi:hypothetical protein
MGLKEHIRKVLREEINESYLKPSDNVNKLINNWLTKLFSEANMYYDKAYETRHDFEWCKDGKQVANIILYFHSDDSVEDSKIPTSERNFEEGFLYFSKEYINDFIKHVPVRRNYLKYLIEEWFDDNLFPIIHQKMDRNDIYITEFEEVDGDVCVPPIEKSEDISMDEMVDYVVYNTLWRKIDLLKKEEEEPGYVEKLYLDRRRSEEMDKLRGN